MEFKKKTIIGEDNNEPPKDYIGAKKDGKFYEYDYVTRSGAESKSISGESGDSDSGSGEGEEENFDFTSIANEILKQSPRFDYESLILPDIYFCSLNGRYLELNAEVVVRGVINGANVHVVPFYKEEPQEDSNNTYIMDSNSGIVPVDAVQIERIASEVINGETYYFLAPGIV